MRFSIDKKALLNPLNKAAAVTEHKNTMPILAAVLVETQGGNEVSVSAYDLEVAYRGNAHATVTKPGKVAVAARSLAAIVSTLPEGEVVLSVEKNRLVISAGDVEFRLATLPAEEFPVGPNHKTGVTFDVSGAALKEAFGRVVYAASTDEARYTLNGVLLEAQAGKLVTTATDGHRLARNVVFWEKAEDAGGGVIVSRKTAASIVKSFGDAAEVRLTVSEDTVSLATAYDVVIARLIDGQYPDVASVIPATEGRGVTLDRKAVLGILGRMKLVDEAVTFEVKDGRMILSAKNADAGDVTEWFPVTPSVPTCKFKLNGAYVREALGAWGSEHVVLHIPADDLSPIRLDNGEEPANHAIVMPMRGA